MDHNKKSGNDPIEVKYKAEVEEILDGNRPSLTPKLLDSSLDHNDKVSIELLELRVEVNKRTGLMSLSKKMNHKKLTDLK